MKFILILLLSLSIHSQQKVTSTCYNATKEQCNADFQHTASMFRLNLDNPYSHRILAVSRDLETKGFILGSTVLVTGAGKYNGVWTIRDRTNKRWKERIDFLVNIEMPVGKWNNVKICVL